MGAYLFQYPNNAKNGLRRGHDGIQNVRYIRIAFFWKTIVILDRHEILLVHADMVYSGLG